MGDAGPRRLQPGDADRPARYLCLRCSAEPWDDELLGYADPPVLGHRGVDGEPCGPVIDLWGKDG